MHQTTGAIMYLHSKRHDIKPGNLLLTIDDQLEIAGIG
jgi:hypothetical protein